MCEEDEKMEFTDSSADQNNIPISDSFSFFQLPYPVQIEIVSYLSLRDTKAFASTCADSRLLLAQQAVWKKKLWHHCKVINLCLEGKRRQSSRAEFLVRDPLLVDMRKLYEVLHPDCPSPSSPKGENMGDFYSSLHSPPSSPSVMSFSSVGLQELLNFLNTFFHRPPPIFYDPFSRGHDAPSFLLFGPPETPSAKKLALCLIASKNATFETVGLVKGKPGGLGGGVTVEFTGRLMNFLPVRRARPRLLVQNQDGVLFHPDVAQVVKQVDGLIYYMDATCTCDSNPGVRTRGPKKVRPSPVDRGTVEQSWQSNNHQHSGTSPDDSHSLDNEFYELEAMLKATPDVLPPVLVVLVRNECPTDGQSSSEDSEDGGQSGEQGEKEEKERREERKHRPADLHHRMLGVENPWMISSVDVHSLKGVHYGINWLYERTRILKGK